MLDGATGTALQAEDLKASDFGGEEYEGCNENLVLTRPDVILKVHRNYLQAGADIVETDTFGGTPFVLAEYGLEAKTYEINKRAAELAREACAEFSNETELRFVAGSIGPTTKSLSLTGGIDFDSLAENYYQQVKGLYDGGTDYFLIETCNDTANIKACLVAIDRLNLEVEVPCPVAISATIEAMGTMLAGQAVDAFLTSVEHRDLLYVGLNCATGPEFMTDHIRTLAEYSRFPVSCVPNAGLPDENGCYLESPEMVTRILDRFAEKGWINVVGGCCGTHAGHVHALKEAAKKWKPRTAIGRKSTRVSGIEFLEVNDDTRPILIGERTNVIGSRKFKDLIVSGALDEATEIGRKQVKAGAHIVDVCLSNPDRDELADIEFFLPSLLKKIKAPVMIDSTDSKVMQESLKKMQGKAILNSINLEDGEIRFEEVVPLALQYGAALVVGCIDDDPQAGMGVTRTRKLEIAERSYKLLTEKYKFPAEDIFWDALVFPCGTGDEQYRGSAVETIEGIRLLKAHFPLTKSVLGISNVSFGLPTNAREVLNAVFLYHCVKAGLDCAIVNSEKIPRFGSLSEEEIKACEDLLWNRGEDPVAAFALFFRSAKPKVKAVKQEMSLDNRLAQYIIEGTKDGLIVDLDLKRKESSPLEIINGPLMKGMDEVGRLFNKNEMIVAEVLQSAEAMKAAVSHLEKFMESRESSQRGKVLLATVKGDVHDIGKNLVEIILGNNGFQVINLGIKVPSDALIQAAREHSPSIIGLSGLLVKSAQQMETSAEDLRLAGVQVPILVGGAALTQNFTDKRIAKAYGDGLVVYAKDAMSGLDLAKQILDPAGKDAFRESVRSRQASLREEVRIESVVTKPQIQGRSPNVEVLSDLPKKVDYSKRVVRNQPLDQIWNYVNHLVLYNRHLGVAGEAVKLWQSKNFSALQTHAQGRKMLEIASAMDELKKQALRESLMAAHGVWQFFPALSVGNRLRVYEDSSKNPNSGILCDFDFPRQAIGDHLSISDYVNPLESFEKSGFDSIALFCVTAGKGIREKAQEMKEKGDFLSSHMLSALALETAEAYAELLHGKIRSLWGFPDSLEMTMMDRFQAKYRGCRYSFGYPACPNLEDQQKLFKLLRPEDIGVQLTEGYMMDPEASVSALVVHHPQAKYFSVGVER